MEFACALGLFDCLITQAEARRVLKVTMVSPWECYSENPSVLLFHHHESERFRLKVRIRYHFWKR